MTIETTRADLRATLSLVTPASSPKASIAIMDGVLFAPSGDGTLTLSCTSAVVAASATLACKHGGESFVVTAETLRRVIDSLPEGPIEVAVKDGRITVVGGSAKTKLPVRDAADFPKVPASPDAVVKVRADVLQRLLLATRHASSGDTKIAMPSRDGTHVRVRDGKLEATAAGGNCMARAWGPCEAVGPLDILVPSLGCGAILKALAALGGEETVSIAVSDSRVFVAHVSAQLYDEKPLPADKLLAAHRSVGEICVSRDALIGAVKRALITADDARIALVCRGGGELVVSSESTAGDSATVLQGTVPEAERIMVSASYLLPQLEQVIDDEVRIRIDKLDGLGFLLFASDGYTGLVAPMMDVKAR